MTPGNDVRSEAGRKSGRCLLPGVSIKLWFRMAPGGKTEGAVGRAIGR
jgi:hypothetical protein